MPRFTARFAVPAEIYVDFEATNEEDANEGEAYDRAVRLAQEALDVFSTGAGVNGVRLAASIDGVGADDVSPAL